jgi:hypothetical protein
MQESHSILHSIETICFRRQNNRPYPCQFRAVRLRPELVRLSGSRISADNAMRREAILFDIVFHDYA